MAMEMARYNKWQNSMLLGCCDELSEEQLGEDRGMFFGSLLATLNHKLHVDIILLDYIRRGVPPEDFDPKTKHYDRYPEFRPARIELDDAILNLVDQSPPDWFDVVFGFESSEAGRMRQRPRALFITQMFNHQTHHRSQITSELHRIGQDYGSTDLPRNPLSQS